MIRRLEVSVVAAVVGHVDRFQPATHSTQKLEECCLKSPKRWRCPNQAKVPPTCKSSTPGPRRTVPARP